MWHQDVASQPHAASRRHLTPVPVRRSSGPIARSHGQFSPVSLIRSVPPADWIRLTGSGQPPRGVTKTLDVTQCGIRMWRHNPMRRHEDTWRHQMWRQDVASQPHAASLDVASGRGVTSSCSVREPYGVGEWHDLPLRTRHQTVASKARVASWPHVSSTTWRHERVVRRRGPTMWQSQGVRGVPAHVFKMCLQASPCKIVS